MQTPVLTTSQVLTNDGVIPDGEKELDQTVTLNGPDPTELQQDDNEDNDDDNSPMVTNDDDDIDDDVPVAITLGAGGGGKVDRRNDGKVDRRGDGMGNGKPKLKFAGGACEVALLIKNAGTSNCACFTGVTSARVGRRAPRMASGNGGSQRGPVYKRWKCKDLVPDTGAACTCEA
jgi:hypothetical protein